MLPDSDEPNTMLQSVYDDWLKARNVIMGFLIEIRPDMPVTALEHNAAAIIARLSHAGMTIRRYD